MSFCVYRERLFWNRYIMLLLKLRCQLLGLTHSYLNNFSLILDRINSILSFFGSRIFLSFDFFFPDNYDASIKPLVQIVFLLTCSFLRILSFFLPAISCFISFTHYIQKPMLVLFLFFLRPLNTLFLRVLDPLFLRFSHFSIFRRSVK